MVCNKSWNLSAAEAQPCEMSCQACVSHALCPVEPQGSCVDLVLLHLMSQLERTFRLCKRESVCQQQPCPGVSLCVLRHRAQHVSSMHWLGHVLLVICEHLLTLAKPETSAMFDLPSVPN